MSAGVIAALALTGTALVVLPDSGARRRLRGNTPTSRGPARPQLGRRLLIVLAGCVGLGAILLAGGGMSIMLSAMILGGTASVRRVRTRAQNVRSTQVAAVQAGLDTLTAELRVGAHPAAACAAAADDCTDPVADAFRTAAARARLGGSAAAGFRGAPGSVTDIFERVAAVWTVADRHGLALAELLQAVRLDMQGRQRFRRRTEAGLAGARATAAVLAGLPVLGIGLGHLMGAAPLSVLLGGGVGGILLVVGSALGCAGLLWTDRITRQVVQ